MRSEVRRDYSRRPDERDTRALEERLRRAEATSAESQRRLADLTRDRHRESGERAVDQAIRERRIEAPDRDLWLKRYERDPELVTAVLNDLNPAAPKILYTADDLSPADKELARQCDIMLREQS